MWILYTILGLIGYTIAEYYSKIYADTSSVTSMLHSITWYTIVSFIWFFALKNNNQLFVMALLWSLGYVFIGCGLGIFVFHEPITTKQIIALVFAIMAIALLT